MTEKAVPDVMVLLQRYQNAMQKFSATDLADLYAEDGVHEFGFFNPGRAPRYVGRDAIRDAYLEMWASPSVEIEDIRNVAVRCSADNRDVVAEWSARVRPLSDLPGFTLRGVLVLTSEDGQLTSVRDYMDVLGLAYRTGRLAQMAAHLTS